MAQDVYWRLEGICLLKMNITTESKRTHAYNAFLTL